MPTYQYACTACAERLEVVQRFTDDPLTECPACGGALRKVFSPVGVVFKGSGFYKTDSRGKKPSGSSTSSSGGSSGSSSTGSSPASSGSSGETPAAPSPSSGSSTPPSAPPSTGSAAAAAG